MNDKNCTIYALCDPSTQEIRYIGQTIYKVKERLRCHIKDAKGETKNRRCNWIRKMLVKDLLGKVLHLNI